MITDDLARSARRWSFWLLLTISGVAWLWYTIPLPSYFTIHGQPMGGNAIPYGIAGLAFSLLLLWCAACVRVEPVLVRLALLVIGIPVCWSAIRDAWSTFTFLVFGPPSSP